MVVVLIALVKESLFFIALIEEGCALLFALALVTKVIVTLLALLVAPVVKCPAVHFLVVVVRYTNMLLLSLSLSLCLLFASLACYGLAAVEKVHQSRSYD